MKHEQLKLKPKVINVLIALGIIIFIFCISKVVMLYTNLYQNKKSYENLINDVIIKTTTNDVDSETSLSDTQSFKVDFEKLLSINNDIVAWIRLNNDKINYPVVKGKDNSYYLTHTFDKKYNQVGSIFMDHRNTSFDNQNVVLFGHAMLDDSMFGSLSDLFYNGYFDNEDNNYIELVTQDNKILKYRIFSLYTIESEDYYITTSFDTKTSFKEFIDTIKRRSIKSLKVDVTEKDKILTLSTCAGTGGTTKRRVVHAVLIDNQN